MILSIAQIPAEILNSVDCRCISLFLIWSVQERLVRVDGESLVRVISKVVEFIHHEGQRDEIIASFTSPIINAARFPVTDTLENLGTLMNIIVGTHSSRLVRTQFATLESVLPFCKSKKFTNAERLASVKLIGIILKTNCSYFSEGGLQGAKFTCNS